jgi:hypothetical protein
VDCLRKNTFPDTQLQAKDEEIKYAQNNQCGRKEIWFLRVGFVYSQGRGRGRGSGTGARETSSKVWQNNI